MEGTPPELERGVTGDGGRVFGPRNTTKMERVSSAASSLDLLDGERRHRQDDVYAHIKKGGDRNERGKEKGTWLK